MLCTICKQRLNPKKDNAIVWRSVSEILKTNLTIEMAKMPIHNKCIDQIDNLIMSNKIRKAAGLSYYIFKREIK